MVFLKIAEFLEVHLEGNYGRMKCDKLMKAESRSRCLMSGTGCCYPDFIKRAPV